jgi:hypothetical protein
MRGNRETTVVKITADLNGHLQNPVYIKTVRREPYRSGLYGRAVIRKPLYPIKMLQSVYCGVKDSRIGPSSIGKI